MHSAQFRLVAQSCPTLCNPMNRSMPGLPVHHQLPESTRSPSNRCCHPTISSSVVPFSFCLQSFPASGSFPVSQLFTSVWLSYWGFSFRIGSSNEHSSLISFRMDWLDLLAVQGLSRVFSNTKVQKHQFFGAQLSYSSTLTSIHDYWKKHSFA